jgi:hypothetical protein
MSALQGILRSAVRALGFARFFDWQVHSGMRIPQMHLRHRTRERQIFAGHHVLILRISLDERGLDRAFVGHERIIR